MLEEIGSLASPQGLSGKSRQGIGGWMAARFHLPERQP
jgi:hypothetical protein